MFSDYLMVYGTLQKGSGNAMSEFLLRNSEYVCKGYFQGKLYKISWFPGATCSADSGDTVYGSIFKLKHTTTVFEVLDDYEGYDALDEASSLFKREILDCFTEYGDAIKAWVYLYNQNVKDAPRILSGDFLKDGNS
ncbi:gamma-glutamylcyclotransferase [Hyunsoonleella sp. SJ7]|uniref:Gamma-glutamylcyclotransferase n=1 Tax=Hyunsoonleella aquatilis TaxID=2762758 RepID=A0A923KN08_9FLAO|nr:gamma-glutamylcyclotransferase family protein [Hyunsoonleella aquatilis]MBC3759620.1 gamma-glutamylcyclotransferase [Hyunsoonleella aquatilis]